MAQDDDGVTGESGVGRLPGMTCGQCPVFKPVPPERYLHGIRGDGWCWFAAPAKFDTLLWGETNRAISKTRTACSLGPVLLAAAADQEQTVARQRTDAGVGGRGPEFIAAPASGLPAPPSADGCSI